MTGERHTGDVFSAKEFAMWFGRRKSARQAATLPAVEAPLAVAPVVAEPRPQLTDEQIFALVHERVSASFGDHGPWTVRRRTSEDTDDFFSSVFVTRLSREVTLAVHGALHPDEVLAKAPADATEAAVVAVPIETAQPVAVAESIGAEPETLVEVAAQAFAEMPQDAEFESGTSVVAAETTDDGPSHRHDEPVGDAGAKLDEDAVALGWEPAPITVWTDLKKPVTGPIAVENLKQNVPA
jgi:hypothetical protein